MIFVVVFSHREHRVTLVSVSKNAVEAVGYFSGAIPGVALFLGVSK